jgi:hypothetical protein
MASQFYISTLVTRPDQYQNMRRSMAAAGFAEPRCRFAVFDNSTGNRYEPYAVLRQLRNDGDEPYVILCHQDLLFPPESSCDLLVERLSSLQAIDPDWAVAGNAGVDVERQSVLHLDDPGGSFRATGLPRQVVSLDENFLVMPRARFPEASRALAGFHFYGTDLCLHAIVRRKHAYVIDFPIRHFGVGNFGADFERMRGEFADAWRPHLLTGLVRTTCTEFLLSRYGWLERLIHRNRLVGLIRRRGWQIVPLPGHRHGP